MALWVSRKPKDCAILYSDVTAAIGNITYIFPGAVGSLYSNSNTLVLEGNSTRDVRYDRHHYWNLPVEQAPNCGHDFGCIAQYFSATLAPRQGPGCSNPFVIEQQDLSNPWRLLGVGGLGSYFDLSDLDAALDFSAWYTSAPAPDPLPSVTYSITYEPNSN